MIYDTLNNLHRYLGIHPNLDTALHFLMNTNFDQLSLGITEIDGQNVYANVMEARLKKADTIDFEYHKNYADIQFDLIGEEKIAIGFLEQENTSTYDGKSDFGKVECQKETVFPIGPGRFIICFVDEPHKPGIESPHHHFVKKGVLKVLMKT